MGKSIIEYNGYRFPQLGTHCEVTETFVYDDSERAVKATRFRVRIQTLIISDTPNPIQDDDSNNAGREMHRVRRLLSKPGASFIIDHEGFYPGRLEINTPGSQVRDISWGPKPTMLSWEPVGHTAAVEVVWECEFEIPICDGTIAPRFHGVSQFNYAVSFAIDLRGYTTRTISGTVEIALTRITTKNRNLADSVDAYRDLIVFGKPTDFERTVEWSIAEDKRSANFTIIDQQIQSPNAYPPGVVEIQATHRVGVARSSMSTIENVLSASIELAPNEHKSKAWMIFRELFRQRKAATTKKIFLERLEVVEEIYENRVSFQAVYRFSSQASILAMFAETGIFKPVPMSVGPDGWKEWSDSILTPFAGAGEDRGIAGLSHEWNNERIVDMCEYPSYGVTRYPSRGTAVELPTGTLCNELPSPNESWIKFESKFEYREKGKTSISVELKPNDLQHQSFSPGATTTAMPDTSNAAKRYVEDQAGIQILIFTGYAERIGYPIPRPGIITIAGKRYRPVGSGAFDWKFQGVFFCLPKYAAAWKQQYILEKPMSDFDPKDTLQQVQ